MLGCFVTKASEFLMKNVQLSQLLLNLYAVMHARSFSHHAVDMHSLCENNERFSKVNDKAQLLAWT